MGLATVHDLLSSNAFVAILDRSSPPETLTGLQNIKFFQTDITVLDDISAAVDGTMKWTSQTNAALGGVINCAGVGTAAKIIDAHGEPHSLDLWEFAMAVNLTGSFNLTRLVVKHLVKVDPEQTADAERGVVVFVASAAAVRLLHLKHCERPVHVMPIV